MKCTRVAMLAFALALGLTSVADAQILLDSSPGKRGSGPNSSSSLTGEPFVPETSKDKLVLLVPIKTKGHVAGRDECSQSFGSLPKLTASAIGLVKKGVSVAPICADRDLMEQQKGVENIRVAIAQNPAMKGALRRSGYAADDVVGVVLDGRGATLYVKAH